MSQNTLSLKGRTRSEAGRAAAKKCRQNGRIPGVLYGKGKSKPVDFDRLAVIAVLQKTESENALVTVELEGDGGGSHLALLQEIQSDPLTDAILHLDLHEVSRDEKIRAEVAVHAVGTPEGVRNAGGLMETMLHTLEVECLPSDLPDHLEVNVEHLGLEQAVHVKEVPVPAGVVILNLADLPVFSVTPPRVSSADEPAAAATEPALVKPEKADKAEG